MITDQKRGATRLAEALRKKGVTTVFAVSGHQINSIFDAFEQAELRIIHMRHESAAAYAAAGWAEATGVPGIALVCGGPGFLAALTGVSIAASMEAPMLLLSGGPATDNDVVGAFQYIDQDAIARAVCKTSYHAYGGPHLERVVDAAWNAALQTVPGPVHLNLPIDVVRGAVDDAGNGAPVPAGASASPSPAEAATLAEIAAGLAAARPAIIVRPSAARGAAGVALQELGKRLGVEPVVIECPRGSEDLRYMQVTGRYREADFVVLAGPADFSVHFLSPQRVASHGRVALIDAEGDPVPKRTVDFHLRVTPEAAFAALLHALPTERRKSWIPKSDPEPEVRDSADKLHPFTVARCIREAIGPDDLIVLDGGDFCQWVRLALAALPNKLIWNSRFGAIGGSIPFALAGAASGRYRHVFAVMGDGTFGYHGAEFETAKREGLAFTAIVGNDERWAAEWHAQHADFGRAIATMLTPARYDEVARGYGGRGFNVTDAAALRAALRDAVAGGEPACINAAIESIRSPALPEV